MFEWKSYVYEIYKEKSFSKAAQNLYISQPSLSARIKKIEDELGAPIFDRSTSPLRLTEIGKIYVEAAEEIFKIEQRVENCINDLNTLRAGHLSIGASNVFAAYALPSIITEFKSQFPDVSIRLIEGNTSTLEEMMASNSLDLVIDNNHYDSALYDKELYTTESILLAVPKNFSVNEGVREYSLSEENIYTGAYLDDRFKAVPLSLFASVPFIMLTPGNDTRIRGDKLCREAGFRPNVVLELGQQSTAYMAASTEMGAVFVSDILARKLYSPQSLVYYKLMGDAARRSVYFYHKKHKFRTRAMEEFIRIITSSDQT